MLQCHTIPYNPHSLFWQFTADFRFQFLYHLRTIYGSHAFCISLILLPFEGSLDLLSTAHHAGGVTPRWCKSDLLATHLMVPYLGGRKSLCSRVFLLPRIHNSQRYDQVGKMEEGGSCCGGTIHFVQTLIVSLASGRCYDVTERADT